MCNPMSTVLFTATVILYINHLVTPNICVCVCVCLYIFTFWAITFPLDGSIGKPDSSQFYILSAFYQHLEKNVMIMLKNSLINWCRPTEVGFLFNVIF